MELWKELCVISQQFGNSLWCVMGDFNIVRFSNDKVGGKELSFNRLQEFNECMNSCTLADIRSMGGTWTWSNKSQGTRRITWRLDRVTANEVWIDVLPGSYYEYLPPSTSDHSSMLLHLPPDVYSGPKPFKYFND